VPLVPLVLLVLLVLLAWEVRVWVFVFKGILIIGKDRRDATGRRMAPARERRRALASNRPGVGDGSGAAHHTME
jgi:hypothetical protein